MDNLNDINANPELAQWLASLKSKVAEKAEKAAKRGESSDSGEPKIFLPTIDMSKKFYQNNGKTYPEMQGTVSLLPVSFKGERVTEIPNVLRCWCPGDDDWNFGFNYKILPESYYPEGEVRNRIKVVRDKLQAMMKSGKITWKECKRGSTTLILGLVIQHRNTKGDLISSPLFGGDTLVEHKYVPALVVCPNGKVQTAIQDDLDTKTNAIPYAMACYSDEPLANRKGWMAIKFTDASKGFGYDVTVNTELANPIVMPEGILPKDFNLEDERVKLLYTTDPIYQYLDWHQRGENGEYWNDRTLNYLEGVTKYWEEK
jgi:hypothetical protein